MHFCSLPDNVLKAYFYEKELLDELSSNLVAHTVKTKHYIGLRYIDLS